jgi:hypothetical protein
MSLHLRLLESLASNPSRTRVGLIHPGPGTQNHGEKFSMRYLKVQQFAGIVKSTMVADSLRGNAEKVVAAEFPPDPDQEGSEILNGTKNA